MIRVVLADDHEVVRSGFKMILESSNDIAVVGEAAEGDQAYNVVERERPDILLLDISMPPGRNGLVVCEKIVKAFPETRVAMLTMFDEQDYLFYTLKSGARGYILKSTSATELIEAIRIIANGDIYVHPQMMERLKNTSGKNQTSSLADISARELEILQLLALGHTNKEIAERIFLSEKTVESYRSKIYGKLGLSTRAELVAFAINHKLLSI